MFNLIQRCALLCTYIEITFFSRPSCSFGLSYVARTFHFTLATPPPVFRVPCSVLDPRYSDVGMDYGHFYALG